MAKLHAYRSYPSIIESCNVSLGDDIPLPQVVI